MSTLNIQEEVKEVLDKLQLDVLEKKNAQLVERINHVEEVFSKINEKTLLKKIQLNLEMLIQKL